MRVARTYPSNRYKPARAPTQPRPAQTFAAPIDDWEAERRRSKWTPANRAPHAWVRIDLACRMAQGPLPPVRVLAHAWGWPSSSAHELVRQARLLADPPAPRVASLAPWLTPAGDA